MPAAPAGNSIVLIAAITGLYTENKTKALTTEDTEGHGGNTLDFPLWDSVTSVVKIWIFFGL
jgi:hypothetical protein